MTTITGKLLNAERFDTSRNGNPRYLCVIQEPNDNTTMFYTGVDSMHGYGITNHLGKTITIELKWNRNKLTLQTLKGE